MCIIYRNNFVSPPATAIMGIQTPHPHLDCLLFPSISKLGVSKQTKNPYPSGFPTPNGIIPRSWCVRASSSSGNVAAPLSDGWLPEKTSKAPSLSDVFWPSAGAFAAMAVLGRIDQILASKGVSMTIAPMGAVCAVLFATPSSPGARKYNMFVAQIGCAAIGVLAFSVFGPGWLARSTALAAALAFMIITRSVHPPAASLPLLFIDGIKLHHLNFWYALFPGATGCILLCLIQEMVCYLKDNLRF